ncbi:hypothetical protein [Kitasatospora sp. NPDC058046]|uniref:hypothetical protein n=1 Tax=Kitasatospora sp. NPDC058046 TaxID=3346312 RepID=UPI0036DF5495
MPARTPNKDLRSLLHESRWTQDALARAVNGRASLQGVRFAYDRTSVSHWLSGTRPRGKAMIFICEALSLRLGRIITPSDAGFNALPDSTTRHLEMSPSPARALAALLGSTPERATYEFSPVPLPKPPSSPVEPAPNSEAECFFQTLLSTCGTGCVAGPLHAYLASVTGPRLSARPSQADIGETARLVLLLGRTYEGQLHHGKAQQAYITAMSYAWHARDLDTWAIAVCALSIQATGLRHHRTGHRLACSAVDVADSCLPATSALLLAQLGVTTAYLHSAMESSAHVDQARALASQVPRNSHHACPLGPCTRLDATVEHQAAIAALALGNRTQAIGSLERALLLTDPADRHGSVLITASMAIQLAEAGHVEASLAYSDELLLAAAQIRSTSAAQMVRQWNSTAGQLRRSQVQFRAPDNWQGTGTARRGQPSTSCGRREAIAGTTIRL